VRADARANRERILTAAEEVFGAKGAQASTEEVAARAGVGIATVFRHFPAKADLLEATLVRHFEELTGHADRLAGTADAGAALTELVAVMVRTGATKVTLIGLLTDAAPFPSTAAAAAHQLRERVDRALRRAQGAGAVRADVTVEELYYLIRGLSQAAAAQPVAPDVADGAIRVVLDGLSPRLG
jgi:AcrR family transcriptional regulator